MKTNLNKQETYNLELEVAKKLKFSIKNIKYFLGHDGMPGLNCDVYVDNKKIAHAYDDARGGEMDITPIDHVAVKKLKAALEQEEKYTFSYFNYTSRETSHTIEALVNALCTKKEFEQNSKKGIIFIDKDQEYIASWKKSMTQMLKENHKQGIMIIQKRYDDIVKSGHTVLNAEYLKSLGITI